MAKKLKRAVIKEELVKLTGNYKLTLVLNQFIYWSSRVGKNRWNKFQKEELTRDIDKIVSIPFW